MLRSNVFSSPTKLNPSAHRGGRGGKAEAKRIDTKDTMPRISVHDRALRETFEALDVLDYRRSFDECIEIIEPLLSRRKR